ncbi:carotenoid oxygenase [Corynespora cassiicola Philippines]|uniref:Carotenoid oxygenase n=1 Tax=Corynespora cassiicola Philippines TaxID=1448308 RepID=A0A2T2PA03_CORCC|nr:carotenoid oxygenase [Corynespora cassiicola Philippines]
MATNGVGTTKALKSKWPQATDLRGSNLPCRLEGEVADLIVLGEIPKELDGTFYRVMTDPYMPPHPQNVPLDGDGNISAFRFENGRVDMKMRYVETERFKLERDAGKAMFGLYRNPFSHHPCVRAAVDSTANTNLVLWADRFLALKEGGLPYEVDPHSLDTLGYDPYGQGDSKAKTFTAHPKIDPYSDELVVFGYEAKGLASTDIIVYSLDRDGNRHDEQWVKSPWCAPIHDCAITPNWLILVLWPFEASVERMKKGGHHWAWSYDRPATFIVIPRRKSTLLPSGWQPGEYRIYNYRNSMLIHTAGAWESPDGTSLYVETSRVHDNAFPFFPTDDGQLPAPNAKADFVRFTLDLSQPSGSTLAAEPEMVLDLPAEFPRIDERFLTHTYDVLFVNALTPREHRGDSSEIIFHGLDGLAKFRRSTGETQYYYAGPDSVVEEPIFVPRGEDAEEGDGWVMCMVERKKENRNELVLMDTREFGVPVAVVKLPLHVKAQVHGNWIDQRRLRERKSLVRRGIPDNISGRGALEVE